MTQEEFKKLQQAEKLIGTQKKLDAQIRNLKKCHLLKILYNDDIDGKPYHFDIQARDFTGNNIMEWAAKQFIEKYINHLEGKKIILQEEFDNL